MMNSFYEIICWKNFMIWKKKLKILIINKSSEAIYCMKNIECENRNVVRAKNGRIML